MIALTQNITIGTNDLTITPSYCGATPGPSPSTVVVSPPSAGLSTSTKSYNTVAKELRSCLRTETKGSHSEQLVNNSGNMSPFNITGTRQT